MSAKVAPSPIGDAVEVGKRKRERQSRAFQAVKDVYEFNGWTRIWLAVLWFIAATMTIRYRYPAIAGTYRSTVKALMTSYDTLDGSTLDVRSQSTFYGGLTHALGFLTAYVDKADAAGHPEGVLPVTEYDRILFSRLVVDFKSNCDKISRKANLACYRSGIHPGTGSQLAAEELEQLSGQDGFRKVELLNPNVTRHQLRMRVQQILDQELMFISTYGFRASLEIGVENTLTPHFATVYVFTVSRVNTNTIGSQARRSVVTVIDNVNVRQTPLYICADDYGRIVAEVISLLFLFSAVWSEVVQFNMCRAWRNLNLSDEERRQPGTGWRRSAHLLWFFFAQPWNLLDFITVLNYFAWWIMYGVLLAWSYHHQVETIGSLEEFDAVRYFADAELPHLVWGVIVAFLVGVRVLPHFKTHTGLSVYSATLKLSWQRLKDLVGFFGYVYFLLIVLIEPLFELMGANPLFRDTGTGILNVVLLTFQYLGFQDYFNYDAPTFGAYWLIFMFFFWVVVLISVVILQNVLLALVASAYEESREAMGTPEFTILSYSLHRLLWILYSRWHRWVLRKSCYTLAEELMAATSRPNVSFYRHVFARWAMADLPEMNLIAQLYTDPASEALYLYSPWAWHRASPWDDAQQAPWDEQLDYPMYSWEDVPMNEPGVSPRLRRMPPLFSRNPPDGRPAARGRLPVSYTEADELFSMSEEEVDWLLEAAGWCWGRMARYPVVARFGGCGWSERGRRLVREGLLEVYRRHSIREVTTTTVGDSGPDGGGSRVAADGPPSGPPATKAASGSATAAAGSQSPLLLQTGFGAPNGEADDAPGAEAEAAGGGDAAMQRNRQFSLFNRRGRIAENLDLLWDKVSQLEQHQLEIKALLKALVQQQQQRGAGGVGGVSRGAAGGGSTGGAGGASGAARGAASLVAERPVSGVSRSRGTWAEE